MTHLPVRAVCLLLAYAALLLQLPAAQPVAAHPVVDSCPCPPDNCPCPRPTVGEGACWVAVGCHAGESVTWTLTAFPEHLRPPAQPARPEDTAAPPPQILTLHGHSLRLDSPDKIPR